MSALLAWPDGDDWFAVERRAVRAIVRDPVLSAVPRAPSWLRGCLNRGGRAVPVLDLAALDGRPPAAAVAVVVVWVEGHELGLAAAALPRERRAGDSLPGEVRRVDPERLGVRLAAATGA